MSNYVSAVLTAANITTIQGQIKSLQTGMPFLIKFTNEQKKAVALMDDSRVRFVEKALQYGKTEPKIVPPYTDMAELGKDLDLFKAMRDIVADINRLTEMINDTRMAAGTDAYTAALSIYNSAKHAAKMGVPGTEAIVGDLRKLFDGQGNFKPEVKTSNN